MYELNKNKQSLPLLLVEKRPLLRYVISVDKSIHDQFITPVETHLGFELWVPPEVVATPQLKLENTHTWKQLWTIIVECWYIIRIYYAVKKHVFILANCL